MNLFACLSRWVARTTALVIMPAFIGIAPASIARADAAGTGAISVSVVDSAGAPVGAARVTVSAAGVRYEGVTDSRGDVLLGAIAAGTYLLSAQARGYQAIDDHLVVISADQTTHVRLILSRTSAGSVAVLGRVTVNGSNALSIASAPSVDLDPQDLAGRGIEQLSSLLAQQTAVTVTPQLGGAPGLPQTASIRGPDPSETAIEIDGHQVNNSNTGDFDLELLDPSQFSDVQVVYGIGPSSLLGANTQGGTINFRTIEPTTDGRGLLRLTAGSYGTFAESAQATGTDDRIGYAFSWRHYTTQGEVENYPIEVNPNGTIAYVGSGIDTISSLAKLRLPLDRGLGFAEVTYRNSTAGRDLSAALSQPDNSNNVAPGAPFIATHAPGAAATTNAPAVGVDLEMPVGPLSSAGAPTATIVARHLSSLSIQSISNIDPALNPYLIDQRDRIDDDSIEYDNDTATATITLEADVRRELLDAPAALAPGPPSAAQTQRSIVGRSVWSPTSHLHYTAALYLSRYDTFGSSEDPRVSFVWSPTASAVLRMSMGTAFRAPLLTERAFNPTLTAERTTEYELGYEVRVGSGTRAGTAALNLYRTNLRDPIFFNLNAAGRLTFLANLGRVVYQGAGVSYDAPLTGDTTLHARYGVDIAYPIDNPFAHDPAAPNVVAGQQFQGIPPRKASLGLDHRAGRFDTGFEAAYTTANNPLNRPAYVSLNANTGLTMGRSALALQVLNLTNEFDDRFTLPNAGTPYPTPFGLAPTNAYSLPGRSVTLTFTQKL